MKKSISILILLCMVLSGCGKSSTAASSDEIVLADNQSLKYGQVTKINGNEITVALVTEVSMSDMQSQRGNKGQQSSSPSASGDTQTGSKDGNSSTGGSTSTDNASGNGMPSGDAAEGGGTPPDMSSGSGDSASGGGTPPDMGSGSGDTAGGGTPPDMNSGAGSQNSSDSSSSDKSSSNKQDKTDKSNSSSDSKTQNKVMYQLTGEEETLTIPVGTKVTTTLGTTTTFSRIASDDTLKLLMQKNDAGEEVVVGVWIVA